MSRPNTSVRPARGSYRLQLEPLEHRLAPAVFVVDSILDLPDDNPGDGIATTNSSEGGVTTLRAAIMEANAFDDGGLDTINFNIAPADNTIHFILPNSPLPTITRGVTIDGYSQGDASANTQNTMMGLNTVLRIVLSGGNLGGVSTDGLVINSEESVTIRGLVINSFPNDGIEIQFSQVGHFIQGNYIGTDASGTVAAPNGANGVRIIFSANNVIGGATAAARNLISGNNMSGVEIQSDSNTVLGNIIGLAKNGVDSVTVFDEPASPQDDGIVIFGSAHNQVGGSTTPARNLISGHSRNGVALFDSSRNQVQGNFIGTDVTGTLDRGNNANGVLVIGDDNLIGGTSVGARNLISGNLDSGVRIEFGQLFAELLKSENNRVQGNFIGTDITGTHALGNGGSGVLIVGTDNNVVGGTTSAARNVISGNGDGVSIRAENFQVEEGLRIAVSENNLVQGNFIGTDVTGTLDLGNGGNGVHIVGSDHNTVGGTSAGARNLISGNSLNGVMIAPEDYQFEEALVDASENNRVQGNFIGTDVTGTLDLGNSVNGVLISGSDSNLIGGTTPGARNLISGNGSDGVEIAPTEHNFDEFTTIISVADNNLVQGNFIGTDITGTLDRGNSENGVLISGSDDNSIGGTTAGARNVISGNNFNGVMIVDDEFEGDDEETIAVISEGNRVQNNLIGTDITGTLDRGNSSNGVLISGSDDNLIGGTTAAARNVISGNDDNGVLIVSSDFNGRPSFDNEILGNRIGTQINGVARLGNLGTGVLIDGGFQNSIGGPAAGAGNIIAFNGSIRGDTGVEIFPGSFSNPILRNSIHSNFGLGIDLVEDNDGFRFGVTPNDTGDGDFFGGNRLQNFPVLQSASSTSASTTVAFSLNSTPNHDFRIEFFANVSADQDPQAINPVTGQRHGEGRTFLGFKNVSTDGTGNTGLMFASGLAGLPIGQFVITATATDITELQPEIGIEQVLEGRINDTSEFSAAINAVRGRVFHPFRLVPFLGRYAGFLTFLPSVSAPGPTTFVLYNLPPGVVLTNPTGYVLDETGSHPFITVPQGVTTNVPIRVKVIYTNLFGRYAVTFYNGFRVEVFSGLFAPGAPGLP